MSGRKRGNSEEVNNNHGDEKKTPSAEFLMMRHIFGATAIASPPVDQLQLGVGREREGGEEAQFNADSQHPPPPNKTPALLHLYSRIMVSNTRGERLIVFCLASRSLPCKTPHLTDFFHLTCGVGGGGRNQSMRINNACVSAAPRPSQFRFCACFSHFFSPREGLIVFTLSHMFHPPLTRFFLVIVGALICSTFLRMGGIRRRVHFPQSLADFFITLRRRRRRRLRSRGWDRS